MTDTQTTLKKGTAKEPTLLFFICFFAYMSSYIGRFPLSALMSDMIADGVFDKALAGTVTTAYMLLYGAGQLVFGKLSRNLPPPVLMSTGLIGCAVCNLCMGILPFYATSLVFWGLNGVFNSMLWPALVRAFAEWLPVSRQYNAGVNIGLSIPCGSIVSLLLCSLFLRFLSWRVCFILCGSTVLLAGIITVIGFASIRSYCKDMAREFSERLIHTKEEGVSVKFPFKALFLSLAVMIVPAIMINGALKDSVSNWVPTIISDIFATAPSFSAFLSILIPVVSMAGSYIAKGIDKFFKNELKTSGVLFLISAVCISALVLFGRVNVFLSVALIAISTAATWGINTMIVVLFPYRFAAIGASGTVSGIYNCLCFLFSGVTSSLYGALAAGSGWTVVFAVWLVMAIVASLSSFLASGTSKKLHY